MATAEGRGFCSEVSRESAEPVAATASRVDNWILVEYRGLWGHDALAGSGLSDEIKQHLRDATRALKPAKLLFVRRPDRRGHDGLRVFWGSTPERGGTLFETTVVEYEELLQIDFSVAGEPLDHPLLLVCTHGKHDACCARYGRPLYAALIEQAEDDWVWQTTHVGGDRFAGNLVVLPEGLYFGRVSEVDAWRVLESYLGGRLELDRYRGRCCYPFLVQAAEQALREREGITAIAALELDSRQDGRVVFRAGTARYEVAVEQEPGELAYLTCSAQSLTHPPRYAARILRGSAA